MAPRTETFHATREDLKEWSEEMGLEDPLPDGWYFWVCQPGCLPDSPPEGPYPSEAKAHEAALEFLDYDAHL